MMNTVLAKLALTVGGSDKGRKTIAWVLAAVLSPLILITAVLCSLASGGAEHNNTTVKACFYGPNYTEKVPSEFRSHVSKMREAFSLLDSAIAAANSSEDSTGSLDPTMVKAVFFALCFGEDAPTTRAAGWFVDCFYSEQELTREVERVDENGETVTETETYIAITPLSLSDAYKNLSDELGREITDEDKDNIKHIYTMIAGPMGVENYTGAYEVGGQKSVEIDLSTFSDSSTKNAHDLAAYAINAWQSGWGYVWGTYGQIMTEEMFASKLQQYPEGVGSYADFIQANWVGGRTADCVGLIKGYGWLDAETLELRYGTNGMPDVGANQMYYNASVSGTIDTIPDTPGLAVWHDGHIGVYIGSGEVIEAMGTKYGVVKTKLEGRGWTHWLQVPYISYD